MARATRYPTSETALLQVYGRDKELVVTMKNISATGAFFESIEDDESPPQKGDLVRFSVYLSNMHKNHSVDAEVIWSDYRGFGVRFLNKDEILSRIFTR